MYTTAAPPTYAQPEYYTPHNAQESLPLYSEFDHQVQYLSVPQQPTNDGGYWASAGDNAARVLTEQQPS